MSYTSRMANSWKLTGACFKVLLKNPKLMVYPFITFVASIWILIGFIVYSYGMEAWVSGTDGSRWMMVLMILLGSLFIYFMMAFVAILSNAAIVGASGMLLSGNEPTVGDGYTIAMSRIGALASWSAITGFVSFIVSFGRLFTSAAGIAWSVLTYFVIPVMIFEGVGPFKAIKRSKDILKARWGESLISNFGIWMSLILIYIILAIFLLFSTFFFMTISSPLLLLSLGLLVIITFLFGLVAYTMKGILMTSLYWYSITGDPGFDIPEEPLKELIRER